MFRYWKAGRLGVIFGLGGMKGFSTARWLTAVKPQTNIALAAERADFGAGQGFFQRGYIKDRDRDRAACIEAAAD